jgi:FAD/FMN-containing dehydrogenase
LSDIVIGMRVALASGAVLDIDERRGVNAHLLPAFRVGLGCLGIILSVRLKTAPAHVMRCTKEHVSVDEMIDNLAKWNAEHLFFKNWWFPATANQKGAGDVHLVCKM